jgi:hypothetical protein
MILFQTTMRKSIIVLLILGSLGVNAQVLTQEMALKLSRMPLHCIQTEWPNKTSHLSDGPADHILLPSQLHPVFYGCLDWHSSVHGHWLLIKVLKSFPDISNKDSIISCLANSFDADKIKAEAEYFSKYTGSNTYERTYGWAWLLQLDKELLTWNTEQGQQWHKALQPLTDTVVKIWKAFLPKQTYPNRTGVHPNTAFGLAFALDWARATGDTAFENAIVNKARFFYLNNQKVPAYFEPDGSDFFSPSLEVADLMRRVLNQKAFVSWFNKYYDTRSITQLTLLPVVSDRTDYQTVHLDGLALSRAWCMKGISNSLPATSPKKKLFAETANRFIQATLPNVISGNYGGDHWLATFALYALQ